MPIFTHDCEKCIYCGATALHPHNVVDVYIHLSAAGTIVVRYGNDGPNYYSIPYPIINKMPDYGKIKEMVGKALTTG
jgi:hypothetical protein